MKKSLLSETERRSSRGSRRVELKGRRERKGWVGGWVGGWKEGRMEGLKDGRKEARKEGKKEGRKDGWIRPM